MKRSVLLLAAMGLLAAGAAPAGKEATPEGTIPLAEPERILVFHSNIVVHADASLTVTETIRVRSAGREIKRGIYRYFPTRYKDRSGNRRVVDFDVKEVLRDGRPEAYHVKDLFTGIRVYMGNSDVLLPPGEYTYTLTYETKPQLGLADDRDELRWNVTGTGWAFPIDRASATVELPPSIPRDRIALEGYTGPRGSAAKDFTASLDDSGNPVFSTTRPLRPREGLTIAVTWPRGFVPEPTPGEKSKREKKI